MNPVSECKSSVKKGSDSTIDLEKTAGVKRSVISEDAILGTVSRSYSLKY